MEKENKLIAEFMGMQKTDLGWYDSEASMSEYAYSMEGGNTFEELHYDRSWDWLMPVVEKIDEVSNDNTLFKIEHNRAFIEDTENYHVLIDVMANSRLDATYQAVVEFIKNLNK
tara:strand:- start:7170 stop:7511 length:342 start_codon:yes stop_codon:yes gene_type:complete